MTNKLSEIEEACLKHSKELIKEHVRNHTMVFINGFRVSFQDMKRKRHY